MVMIFCPRQHLKDGVVPDRIGSATNQTETVDLVCLNDQYRMEAEDWKQIFSLQLCNTMLVIMNSSQSSTAERLI